MDLLTLRGAVISVNRFVINGPFQVYIVESEAREINAFIVSIVCRFFYFDKQTDSVMCKTHLFSTLFFSSFPYMI